jgi:hypothetical protein
MPGTARRGGGKRHATLDSAQLPYGLPHGVPVNPLGSRVLAGAERRPRMSSAELTDWTLWQLGYSTKIGIKQALVKQRPVGAILVDQSWKR